MQVFLRHKTTHAKDVLSFLNTQFFKVFGIVANFRLRHTIVNQMYPLTPMVLPGNQILNYFRYDDYIICKPASQPFAQFQHTFGGKAPLVTVIVGPVMREHHLHAEHLGVWH